MANILGLFVRMKFACLFFVVVGKLGFFLTLELCLEIHQLRRYSFYMFFFSKIALYQWCLNCRKIRRPYECVAFLPRQKRQKKKQTIEQMSIKRKIAYRKHFLLSFLKSIRTKSIQICIYEKPAALHRIYDAYYSLFILNGRWRRKKTGEQINGVAFNVLSSLYHL